MPRFALWCRHGPGYTARMFSEIDFPAASGARLRHRFSAPVEVLQTARCEEVAAVIARAEACARSGKWVLGFLAYEAAPAFDSALRAKPPSGPLPLALFVVHDAPDEAPPPPPGTFTCGPWQLDASSREIAQGIDHIRAAITEGDYYQINYTGRMSATFSGDPRTLFQALRATQPESYCLYLEAPEWQVLSVSPELFFDWSPERTLITRPMKGTAPRHVDPTADRVAAAALADSAKERAENLMIVDLLRNDLSRIAETGTVSVPGLFEIEALPTAWQMTSTIRCTTRQDIQLFDVLRALFPCGSVTGAPKVAAMQAIAELETSARGAYCGAIGLIRPGGHATFNVGIRSVTLDARRGIAECGVGSGITSDSTAQGEYAEWLVKRRFLLRASADFELLETLPLEQGRFRLCERHLARLQSSAAHFGFGLDVAAIQSELAGLASAYPEGSWRVRLLVDRNGKVRSECVTFESSSAPALVRLATHPVDSDNEFLRHKTTWREAYAAHAPQGDVFDTLLFNERGEITEFTRGNVVVELDGRRVTPPCACGLLRGVLREELLARGEVVEQIVRREDLARASGLWFVNNLRGMIPAVLG